jgi:hypothetical protein
MLSLLYQKVSYTNHTSVGEEMYWLSNLKSLPESNADPELMFWCDIEVHTFLQYFIMLVRGLECSFQTAAFLK